jgi:2-hydroxy-6-oxonona-2,4-dienedioate hydrolase
MTGRLGALWTDVEGVRMFARVGLSASLGSSSPTIVLVHGQVISSLYMVPTARLLAGEFPVYAPDLPGFGWSGKPNRVLDVPELADALALWMNAIGLPRATLAANSLGCQIVVDLAARRPELVQSLVLAAPTIDANARNAAAQIIRWLRDWPYERPSLTPALLRDFVLAGLPRSLHTFRNTLADRIEDKLPRVQAPTLVVRGSRDPIVPQDWAEEVTRLLPQGRLSVIPGPHCLNYSAPRALTRLLSAFVRQCGGDR